MTTVPPFHGLQPASARSSPLVDLAAAQSALSKEDLLMTYCGMGWRVFPLWEHGSDGVCACGAAGCRRKHPRVRWQNPRDGELGATSDCAQVMAWHNQWPGSEWAVALDDMLVVDVDKKHGGLETLAWLDDEWPGLLGITLSQDTPGGGRQFFYAQCGEPGSLDRLRIVPQGRLLSREGHGGRPLTGLEVKGCRADGLTGSYVGVPSCQGDGREWRVPAGLLELPPPGEELCAVTRAAKTRTSASNSGRPGGGGGYSSVYGGGVDWSAGLSYGGVMEGQDDYLYRAACALRTRDTSDEEAVRVLSEIVRNFVNVDEDYPWSLDAGERKWEYVKRRFSPGASGVDEELASRHKRWAGTLMRDVGSDTRAVRTVVERERKDWSGVQW